MAKIEIDTSKWGQNVKYGVGIVCFLFLMFVGYKVFVAKEWNFDPLKDGKLENSKEQIIRLKDSISTIHKYNDSIGKKNDAKYRNYKTWKKDSDNFKVLKKKFDEARRRNSNLSADDHARLLSEWLNH